MPFDLRMPDGTIIRNVPDDVSQDDLRRLGQRYGALPPAPTPTPTPTPTAAPTTIPEAAPLLDYFTDREGAIAQDRARREAILEAANRADLVDLQQQEGFLDRLGDFFSRGSIGLRSGISDIEAAWESDPERQREAQARARRFAENAQTPIAGETTTEDVKENWFNAIPFAAEQLVESAPQMLVGRLSPFGQALSTLGVAGQVARGRAEADERQDVSGMDVAIGLPVGVFSTALDQFGLGEIIGTAGKNAAIRTFRAGLAEGGTEAIQGLVEYLGSRVGTERGVDAQEAFENTIFSAIAGGLGGAGIRGTGEVATAPFRAREARIQRLADEEARAAMSGLPGREGEVGAAYEAAVARYKASGMPEADAMRAAAADVQAFVAEQRGAAADTGGDERGISGTDRGGPAERGAGAGAAPSTGAVGATGDLSGAATGVEGLGEPTLTEPTAEQVKATVPTINQVFEANVIDFQEAYGVTKLNAEQKKQAARIVLQSPEVDPYDAIDSVLTRGARLKGAPIRGKKAPVVPVVDTTQITQITQPPMPSVDQAAVAPVVQAVEAAAAAAPTGPVPSLAQAAALQTGLAKTAVQEELEARDREVSQELVAPPEGEPAPTVAETATVEKVTPPAVVEERQPGVPNLKTDTPILLPKVVEAVKRIAAQTGTSDANLVSGKMSRIAVSLLKRGVYPTQSEIDQAAREHLGPEGAPAAEAAPLVEAAPVPEPTKRRAPPPPVAEEPVVEEEVEEEPEVDYDEHPLMQEHEARYDDAISEIGNAENMKELRKLITQFKRDGLLDEDDVSEINEKINDAGSNREDRFNEGVSALEEALDNQRDNQRDDVEARINEELEAAPAPAVEAAPAPAPAPAVEEDPYEDLLNEIEGAYRGDPAEDIAPEIDEKAYKLLMGAVESRRASPEKIAENLERARSAYAERAMGLRFKRGQIGTGIPVDTVKDHIANIISGWRAKLNVKTVGSLDELPTALRDVIIRDRAENAAGFVSADGTIYVLAHNLNNISDATAVLYHEALGHMGLSALFGKRLDTVLKGIYESNKDLREEADEWLEDNPDAYLNAENRNLRALEEVLVERSEDGRLTESVWKKIGALFKDFGRRIGMKNLAYTDAEVRALLAMAHDQIVNGPRRSRVVDGMRYMIVAWQGGPRDHDGHSSEFIGTGEGHTAYGWGHYFSTMRKVAEFYRATTAPERRITLDLPSGANGFNTEDLKDATAGRAGQAVFDAYAEPSLDPRENEQVLFAIQFAIGEMVYHGKDLDTALADMRAVYDRFSPEVFDTAEAALRAAKPETSDAGKTFLVSLKPTRDQFMEWRKPLERQSEYIRNALKMLGFEDRRAEFAEKAAKAADELDALTDALYEMAETLAVQGESPQSSPDYADLYAQYELAGEYYREMAEAATQGLTGEEIYGELALRLGDKKAASQALMVAGIRGNTYRGDFRVAGDRGARNFVVFGDSDIEITNKYMRQRKSAKKEAPTVARLKKKVADSHTAAEMSGAVGDLFYNTRGVSPKVQLLSSVWKSLSAKARRASLGYFYYNRGIIRSIAKLSGPVSRKLAQIGTEMNRMNGTRNEMMRTLNYNVLRWRKFNAKFKAGGRMLADLINASTLSGVDPRHASFADALANDPKYAELVKEGASKRRLDNREATVRYVYDMMEALRLPENGNGEGEALYNMAIGGFERNLDNEHRALIASIQQSGLPKDRIKEAVAGINQMYADAKKLSPYAPLYRSGEFWVRVGKGKNKVVFRVESETAWFQAIDNALATLREGGDTRTNEEIMADSSVLRYGRDIEGMQADFMTNEPSDVLKKVYETLDSGNLADPKAIKDLVFQMYAASLPKGTMYEKMQHRTGVAGFSADVLRAYTDSQITSINRLTHLGHSRKMRRLVGEAYGMLEGNPNRLQLTPYVDEMAQRVSEMLSPGEPSIFDKLANIANKITFFQLLTSVKSALNQFLQLPITGLPILSSRYGTVPVVATATRYMATVYNKLGTTKVDETGTVVTNWGEPSMGDSKYVNEHPDPEMREALKYGWKDAQERGILGTTYGGEMVGRKLSPSEQYQPGWKRTGKAVFNFMTGGMHHLERISREMFFMSAFELEYEKRRAEGVDPATARAIAADTAADLTLEALFDYAESSKPRALKNPLGRVAFQFFSFSMQMASLLTRSFMGMISVMPTMRERVAAAQQFFGIIGMTWMFAGAVGMPGYTFMMGLVAGIRDMLTGDEDDEPYEDEDGNPLGKRNLDLWFREWFLPHYFGPDTDIAQAFGSDRLNRVVEMGPISELTGINFGSSVGLDGLFFRDDTPVDTDEEALRSMWYTVTLGATGSVANNFIKGARYAREGDWQRAAEYFAPAGIRNSLVANRLASEGYITPTTQDVVAERETYTSGLLFAQTLGYGRTDVAQVQKTNILARRMVAEIERERGDLTDDFNKVYRDVELNRASVEEAEQRLADLWKETDLWNRRTGFVHPLTPDNLRDSLETRTEDRLRSRQGLRMPEDYEPYIDAILRNRQE